MNYVIAGDAAKAVAILEREANEIELLQRLTPESEGFEIIPRPDAKRYLALCRLSITAIQNTRARTRDLINVRQAMFFYWLGVAVTIFGHWFFWGTL